MAVLSNVTIHMLMRQAEKCEEIECDHLEITPFNPAHVQPSSYDLTVALERPLTLYHSRFHLLSTVERIRMPSDLRGQVLARSSVARAGVIVEWAGYIDPGFDAEITLEVMAMDKAFVLHPGDRIAQISFEELDQPANPVYCGRYQGQTGPTESRFKHGDL